ncbi:MAG: mismatch repair protein MutS domain protein [Candidatus Solibacter sp.]|nr:mismatch repair protein MutS domain protein [Candidatus Solibacter sp.]
MPWWLALLIPVIAVSVRRFRRCQAARSRTWRLRLFYERGVQRAAGDWAENGFAGEEFLETGRPYARDLGLFGEGSLFELMCITGTAIGRRRLAGYLQAAAPIEEVRLRQPAVAVLGDYESAESRWETFARWLDTPAVSSSGALRIAAAVSSALPVGIVAAVLLTASPGVLP